MATVLVHLIGGQMAPNLFLLQEESFQQVDRHLFITTALMEQKNKVQHLMLAANITEGICQKVLVQEDNLEDIKVKLDALGLSREDEYWVNITGGTKIMSISAYAYFSQPRFRVQMYYVPVGQAFYWQMHPLDQIRKMRFETSPKIMAYMTCYGLRNVTERPWPGFHEPFEETQRILGIYSNKSIRFTPQRKTYGGFAYEINAKHEKDRNANISLDSIRHLAIFLDAIGFTHRNSSLLFPDELTYLTSGWFEEWVAYNIQQYLGLDAKSLQLRIETQEWGVEGPQGKREFDVLFIYRNTLYILECKVNLPSHKNDYDKLKDLMHETLQKLASYRKHFGINVATAFLTLATNLGNTKGRKKNHFARLSDNTNVLILDRYDLQRPVTEWVEQLINYV